MASNDPLMAAGSRAAKTSRTAAIPSYSSPWTPATASRVGPGACPTATRARSTSGSLRSDRTRSFSRSLPRGSVATVMSSIESKSLRGTGSPSRTAPGIVHNEIEGLGRDRELDRPLLPRREMKRNRQLEIGTPIAQVGPRPGAGLDLAHELVDGDGHGTGANDRSRERPAQKLAERTAIILREELREERIANTNAAGIAGDVKLARRGVADPVVEEDLDVVGEADHAAPSRIEEPISLIEMAEDPARFRPEQEPQQIKKVRAAERHPFVPARHDTAHAADGPRFDQPANASVVGIKGAHVVDNHLDPCLVSGRDHVVRFPQGAADGLLHEDAADVAGGNRRHDLGVCSRRHADADDIEIFPGEHLVVVGIEPVDGP